VAKPKRALMEDLMLSGLLYSYWRSHARKLYN